MDAEQMKAAQRTHKRVVVVPEALAPKARRYTDADVARAIARLSRRPLRRKPTRQQAILYLRGLDEQARRQERVRQAERKAAGARARTQERVRRAERKASGERAAKRPRTTRTIPPPTPRSRAGW